MNIGEYFRNKSGTWIFITGLILTFFVGYIDYLTGYEIGLSVFYLMPIGFIVWFDGKRSGFIISVISVFIITAADFYAGHSFQNYFVELWNSFVHLSFFAVVTILLAKLKSDFEERAAIILELQKALKEIKTLTGLLPICAWCKNVRDDKGYWKNVESYISEHSDAEFTHGICPDCLKKVSPEVYKKIERNSEQGS